MRYISPNTLIVPISSLFILLLGGCNVTGQNKLSLNTPITNSSNNTTTSNSGSTSGHGRSYGNGSKVTLISPIHISPPIEVTEQATSVVDSPLENLPSIDPSAMDSSEIFEALIEGGALLF